MLSSAVDVLLRQVFAPVPWMSAGISAPLLGLAVVLENFVSSLGALAIAAVAARARHHGLESAVALTERCFRRSRVLS